MSFSKDPELEDAYETFRTVCDKFDFQAYRVDHHIDANRRIIPDIIDNIKRSAFIIADVSEPRPNVYYEIGWGQALNKPVIVTAKEGTQLQFDIYDVPTLFWRNQRALREGLLERIQKLAKKAGR